MLYVMTVDVHANMGKEGREHIADMHAAAEVRLCLCVVCVRVFNKITVQGWPASEPCFVSHPLQEYDPQTENVFKYVQVATASGVCE